MSVLLDLFMKGNSEMSSLMDKVPLNGKTEDLIKADGNADKCMAMVYFYGQTGTNTKGNMFIVRSKEKEPSIGTMEKYLSANGLTERSTVGVS